MQTSPKGRQLYQENFSQLSRRKRIVDRGGVIDDSPAEVELAKILSVLTEAEIERVADIDTSIFRLSHTALALQKSDGIRTLQRAENARWGTALVRINQELLMNRWRSSETPTFQQQVQNCLTREMMDWLSNCVYEDLIKLSEIGVNLSQLNVSHRFIYMAGKSFHNTRAQRNVMAYCMPNKAQIRANVFA